MSKGGVRHTTVDGLPRVVHLLRSCSWCCCAGMVSDVQVAFRTQTWRVSRSADVSRHIGPLQPRSGCRMSRGALWFRDGMSRDMADCPPMLHLFVACEVGRHVSFWGACVVHRWRPYRVECTGSLPTSEVKRRRARLVLGWGTAREDLRVLPAFRLCVRGLLWLFCPRVVGITPRIPIPEAQWRSG
jgi:hypothetical protein